jgi:hypothetical protein
MINEAELLAEDVLEIAHRLRQMALPTEAMVLEGAASQLQTLVRERDMYQHRCLELVKQHDLQRDEIENLRRKRRERA